MGNITKKEREFREYLDKCDSQLKAFERACDELVAFVERNKEGKKPLQIFNDFRENVECYFHWLNKENKELKELEEKVNIKGD